VRSKEANLQISTETIKELREKSGAGIMECRTALIDCGGDMTRALESLKEKGLAKAKKTAERVTAQGLVEAYIHTAGRIGAMVEVNCETDFVARTDEFKELARCLAMQVAAMSPQFITKEEMPAGADVKPEETCLLLQPYIRDPARTVNDIIVEVIAKTGENIRVKRFVRFELGNYPS
jgi:elongation factor Ts